MNRSVRLGMASLLAAAASSAVLAPAAFAQTTTPVNLIDATASTQLDIHKYLGDTTALPHNGQPVDTAQISAKPLEGIAFDVYEVQGVDLTTNAGWLAAANLSGVKITAADIAAGSVKGKDGATYQLGAATQVLTDASGNATFDGKVALYIVNENLAASTYADAGKVSPAAPFAVTLPMTNANDTTAWDYSIDVYPKNTQDSITKAVLDGNVGTADQHAYTLGQKLTYRLDSTVSVSDSNGDKAVDGKDIGFYFIGDKLADGLTFSSATVTLSDGTVLTEGTDYALTTDGGYVKISMTSDGLDKLAKIPGGTVTTDIVATVTDVVDPAGVVANTATFVPSNSWWVGQGNTPLTPGDVPGGDNPGVPSNEVESQFGGIVINKTAQDSGKVLAGAEFSVFLDSGNDGCTAADVSGTALASATSDADGNAVFNDLQLSNFYNGAVQTELHHYCLAETKAPVGYELLANPVQFDVTKAGVIDLANLVAEQKMSIVDMPSNIGNNLPLTGGEGTMALSIIGVALGAAGVGGYFAASKRRKAADNA